MGEGSEHNPFAPPTGAFIDNLLYAATAIPGFIFYIVYRRDEWAASMKTPVDPEAALGVVYGGFALAMIGPLLLAAYQWTIIAKTGKSLAKRWLGTRIIREDTGTAPGFVNGVLLRSWLFGFAGVIPYVGSCIGFIDAVAIFNSDRRQTLHDRVARTIVIQA